MTPPHPMQVRDGGKEEGAEKVCSDECKCQKDCERKQPREQKTSLWNGKRCENENVKEVGKQQVPFENGDAAHHDEAIDDVEKVISHLQPCRPRPNGVGLMVSRVKVE